MMRIGEVAARAGVNVQTLRYYERRGLLANPDRSAAGLRQYGPEVVEQIRFIRRAQELGFTLEEIRDLLRMWSDSVTSCSAVERRAADTLGRIEAKIEDLSRMKQALGQYVFACRNKTALQTCPLLTALGATGEG
jgi:Hg(II)-responsive transcriptional regulator